MADVHEYNVKQKDILVTHKGGKGHKCHICNKEFILFSELNTHLSSVHGGIKKPKCDRYVLIDFAYWMTEFPLFRRISRLCSLGIGRDIC